MSTTFDSAARAAESLIGDARSAMESHLARNLAGERLDAALLAVLRARARLEGLPDEGPVVAVLKLALGQFQGDNRHADERAADYAARQRLLYRIADNLAGRLGATSAEVCACCVGATTWDGSLRDPLGAGVVCSPGCAHQRRQQRDAFLAEQVPRRDGA